MAKPKVLSRRASINSVDGFLSTIRHQILHCGNLDGNNNKFYCLELQHNESTGQYRLFSNYGRVGRTPAFEIRDTLKIDGVDHKVDSSNLSLLEDAFEDILRKKQKGKKIKSDSGEYIEKYEAVDIERPSIGSDNLRAAPVATTKTTKTVAPASQKPVEERLVKFLFDENIHQITSMTAVKFGKNGLETPLGPLTTSHVDKAEKTLQEIQTFLERRRSTKSREFRDLNNHFYSLIPHDFGARIPESALISTGVDLNSKVDLLSQMKTTIGLGTQPSIMDELNLQGVDLDFMTDQAEFERLRTWFDTSRADCHNHLNKYKVKNIYNVTHDRCKAAFEKASPSLKPIKQLFHGSRSFNVLSILVNGFVVPPSTASHVTARMFGDGVYAASASTKALNYATGYWDGSSGHRRVFVFITEFAMGNTYIATHMTRSGPPKEFDSIWAQAHKGSLVNDEFIVYSQKQTNPTHLIELTA